MLPYIPRRARLGLVFVLVSLAALFGIDVAHGQFGPKPPAGPNVNPPNPPKTPFGPGPVAPAKPPTLPDFNPPKNDPFEHKYRCMECGATFTSSVPGGPGHCPSCGVKFINGGFDMPGGPVGSAGRAPSSSGVATTMVVVVILLGIFFVGFLGAVGLIVFFIVRLNRRPAAVRLRPRLIDEYDAR